MPAKKYSTEDVLTLYILLFRNYIALKRLTSLIDLKKPPGIDERSAKPGVQAHLLMILLVDALEASPRWADAA